MIATGDWWAPYYNDDPFFDKPVLFHQLQGAAMLVFGQNELGARMVPALAALDPDSASRSGSARG